MRDEWIFHCFFGILLHFSLAFLENVGKIIEGHGILLSWKSMSFLVSSLTLLRRKNVMLNVNDIKLDAKVMLNYVV